MPSRWCTAAALSGAILAWAGPSLQAQQRKFADQGKLLATGGAIQVEGAGGGGLVPWALITGYGTRNSWGANVHGTFVETPDFQLAAYGVAVGLIDRFEFSYTRHNFKGVDALLDGLNINQDIFGAKVKLFGDAVYTQGTVLPQIAVGALYHHHAGIDASTTPLPSLGLSVVDPVSAVPGAAHNNGVAFYIAGTKVFLKQSLLLNVTGRLTKANQFGLLGFGRAPAGADAGDDKYKVAVEASAAYLLSKKFAVGGEFRSKPRILATDAEDDAFDGFVAWFPNKNISLVVAYLYLGNVLSPATANETTQDGVYLSLQTGF